MKNTRRREFLTMTVGAAGAAGAAAFIPSFFSTAAFAQGNAPGDPLLREIMNQMKRHTAGLAALPPKGNAQAIAGTHRMLAAWMKADKFDAKVQKLVNHTIARDGGPDSLIRQITNFDFAAAARAQGIALSPGFRLPTYADGARAIGTIRAAGFSFAQVMATRSTLIESKAEQLNRTLLVRSGQQPGPMILRVQGYPEGVHYEDGFSVNCQPMQPDGSQVCTWTELPGQTIDQMWAEAMYNGLLVLAIIALIGGLFCYVGWEICLAFIFLEALWGLLLWYLGMGG